MEQLAVEQSSTSNETLRQLYQERIQRKEYTREQVHLGGWTFQIFQKPGLSVGSVHNQDSVSKMCKYIQENQTEFKGKRVLELGAGVGVIGLLCASYGADITLTDCDALIPLLEKNIEANTQEGFKIRAKSYLWGSDASSLQPPFDVIIANDIAYNESSFEQLEKSLVALSDTDTKIFLSYRNKHTEIDTLSRMYLHTYLVDDPEANKPRKEHFLDHLKKHFTWKQISSFSKVGDCTLFLVQKKPRFWLLENE